MAPGQGQASAWVGGGPITGLASDASIPFLRFFEDRLNFTGTRHGVDPMTVLKEFIKGKAPFLSVGGVTFAALPKDQQKALREKSQGQSQ
jgi:hypothetical protein